jgi:hypothetical protein
VQHGGSAICALATIGCATPVTYAAIAPQMTVADTASTPNMRFRRKRARLVLVVSITGICSMHE